MNPPSRKALLGVETSVTGRRWVGPSPDDERYASMLAQRTPLSPLLCTVLGKRRIKPECVDGYLSPKIRDLMRDPSCMLDMDRAVERFCDATRRSERVAILADYDVDGACSAALLIAWLRYFGRDASIYVPDRQNEGFGPNESAMSRLAKHHDLIICVDCGTTAVKSVAAAAKADVIILDHHAEGEQLPSALAIVNPNRSGDESGQEHLSAAGVVFMFLVGANREMRKRAAGRLPDLLGFLDLVALATVADMVPLTGINRAFVRQGITVLRRRERPGLRALADVARIDAPPSYYHLGFVLGPRINAGGRIGDSMTGVRLLVSRTDAEAMKLAASLDGWNARRKEISDRICNEALEDATIRGLDAPLVWAAREGWHQGVVGIAAGHLARVTGRPSLVIGMNGREGKGSGRSVPGVDLGAAIARCKSEGWLIKAGGHKMAAGITVEADKLEPFLARLSDIIANRYPSGRSSRHLSIDGLVSARAASIEMIESLEAAGPFGMGSPVPRFAIARLAIKYRRVLADQHLSMTLADQSGERIEAIAFKAFSTPLGMFLKKRRRGLVHVAGRLSADHYRGRVRRRIQVDDAAPFAS